MTPALALVLPVWDEHWRERSSHRNHMSTKAKIVLVYLALGVLFALYAWLFGDTSHKSFAFNLGMGIVWPVMLFPGLGKAIGAAIIVLFIGAVMAS